VHRHYLPKDKAILFRYFTGTLQKTAQLSRYFLLTKPSKHLPKLISASYSSMSGTAMQEQ